MLLPTGRLGEIDVEVPTSVQAKPLVVTVTPNGALPSDPPKSAVAVNVGDPP